MTRSRGTSRYNVLYWVDYPTPFGGGAVGPSSSDPDTGEILDADVVFYAGAFRDEIAGLRREAAESKQATDAEATQAIRDILNAGLPQPRRVNRGFALRLGGQLSLNFTPTCEMPVDDEQTIAARASLDITTLTDDQAMERIIREVIPHEIGSAFATTSRHRPT